jgi:dTDP-4-amino-4,6-dideoxygalactose transaminase
MPARYLQRMGHWQLRRWQHRLPLVDEKIKQHQQAAATYDDFLASTWLTPPYRPAYAKHGMLRYTIRVANRNQLLAKARKLHIPVGDWFGSPLYPVMGDLSRWGYQAGQCPVAEQACREVINLLTDKPLSERQLTALFSDEVTTQPLT